MLIDITFTIHVKKLRKRRYTYLALGDSYTVGEGVSFQSSLPMQLTHRLRKNSMDIADPTIIAKTGWTTNELKKGVEETNVTEVFDIVSLLIGVNNQYRNYDIHVYEKEFEELLDIAIRYTHHRPENVIVISIPDYGITPFAKQKNMNSEQVTQVLEQYNHIAKHIANRKKTNFYDITSISREAENCNELLASDLLHPSPKMYKKWVDLLCFDLLIKLSLN